MSSYGSAVPADCLSVRNLTVVTSSGRRLLNQISFDIAPGEALGLRGPSGAGKTLTGLAVMGLLPQGLRVAAGELRFGSANLEPSIIDRSLSFRGELMAMLFQEPRRSFSPLVAVGPQIAEPIILRSRSPAERKAAKQRILDGLVQLGFRQPNRVYDARPFNLSSGELQRCLLVSALLCRPRLLIADEPTSSLDAASRDRVAATLSEANRADGTALLLISHDTALLGELCSRQIAIEQGRIVPVEIRVPLVKARDTSVRPRATTAPVLKVSGLTKIYGSQTASRKVVALSDVGFVLQPGEILGIVGPSGCGKTTLAKALLHLVDVDSGAIELNGEPLDKRLSPQEVARRGMVLIWQDPVAALNRRRRVGKQIEDVWQQAAHSLPQSGRRVQRLEDLVRHAWLQDVRLDAYPGQLSGGQCQRVVIARALAANPRVLIADEPLAYIDNTTAGDILHHLRARCSETGMALILITHDREIAACGRFRIAEMLDGRLTLMGNAP